MFSWHKEPNWKASHPHLELPSKALTGSEGNTFVRREICLRESQLDRARAIAVENGLSVNAVLVFALTTLIERYRPDPVMLNYNAGARHAIRSSSSKEANATSRECFRGSQITRMSKLWP